MQLVKLAGVCAVALLCAGTALAQTYRDFAGTIVPGVIPLPYGYIPLGPGQHNIAPIAATALTVPAGARYATICASTAAAKYTTDGMTAPTANLGQPLAAGACVSLSGTAVLANFRAISAVGTLDVEYFQ
jgi:hypothetical protein